MNAVRGRGRKVGGLAGPPFVLPRALDAVAEGWARLGARVRFLVVLGLVVALGAGYGARVAAVDARWGGAPVEVLRAERALAVGEAPDDLERIVLPPAAVPEGAVSDVPADVVLALALPAGALLLGAHLDARGPAAALPAGERVLPLPVEAGWGVEAGAFVDVWVLGAGEGAARLVARSRPVLRVDADEGQDGVALVALQADQVAAATSGLAVGRVVLAHAPPP